jgi:hypothetical protein
MRRAALEVKGVDSAVAEISYQQRVAEPPEIRGRQRHAPQRVEPSARCEPANEITVGVEHVDKSQAGSGDITLGGLVLLGVGHIQIAQDVLNTERRKAVEAWDLKSSPTR